jgi:hypothetical protein
MRKSLFAGLFLISAIVACGSLPGSSTRCQDDFISDISCSGIINTLDGSRTLDVRSSAYDSGEFDMLVQISTSSGTVLVTFTDVDGNTVSEEITSAGTAEGVVRMVDGAFEVVFESQGGSAELVSYTISLDEVEN